MKTVVIALLIVLLAAFSASADRASSLVIDQFNDDLSRWDVQEFKGKREYSIVSDDGNNVLQASSHASASGLIRYLDFQPNDFPLLKWRWKITNVIPNGDARTRRGDDYAARIYVIFPHWFKPLSRTINYIWANKLPRGEAVTSRYFSRSMMLAVESGPGKAGRWINEERNVVADYRRLFGEDPSRVGGVAIMTDTDDTGKSAQAWYDDLIFYPLN